jgi:copper(I)-binding protein
LLSLPVMACQQAAPIEVKDAWTRDTVGGTANAAVYMTITSPSADRLVGASAPVANKTDLMTMTNEGGAMGMKYLQAIDLPAGKPVSLNSTGLHVWLAALKRPLKAGQSFQLVLNFEKAGERRVVVSVIAPAAAPPMPGM